MLIELAPLTPEELYELADTLWRGWNRASETYPIAYDEDDDDVRDPIVYDLERTYMPVVNEFWGRQLGCRWKACPVCCHESCGFCPTCHPGGEDAPAV
jgi:hypothetical protein